MHYVIIGGGISGLSLAWFLKQKTSATITILEKESRPGGWIQSSLSDGFLFESGPRSLRPRATTLKLIHDLKLESSIVQADPAAKKRYLLSDGKLGSVPASFLMPILKGLWQDIRTAKGTLNDESIFDFFSRRFGAPFAEIFADAIVSGVFAGDSKKLSMSACFPDLYNLEQQYGSLLRGLFNSKKHGTIYSFQNGMETLIHGLAAELKENLSLNSPVTKLEYYDDYINVHLPGRSIHATHVFLTIPPQSATHLIPDLAGFNAVSVATVNFGYRCHVLPKKGFGYLIPSKEKESILGVVFDSSTFPGQNRHTEETRLTVMIGGAQNREVAQLDSYTLETIAKKAISNHLNINAEPDATRVRVAQNAITQYELNHTTRVQKIEQLLQKRSPRLTLLGNGYFGISVNDCIERASKIAEDHHDDLALRESILRSSSQTPAAK